MEGQSESSHEVKVKAMEQVKKEEELVLSPPDESFKARPALMAATRPNSAVPAQDQLTIFYGGSVLVFDAIPAEKVREIMLIAANSVKPSGMKKAATGCPAGVNLPILTRSPSLQSTTNGLPLCKFQADLPIARRHSLQRFFEKRRDRLGSKNPYPTPTAEKNAEIAKPGICGEVLADEENETKPKVAANFA